MSPVDTVFIGAVSVDGDDVQTLFAPGKYRCWEQMAVHFNDAFDQANLANYSSDLGMHTLLFHSQHPQLLHYCSSPTFRFTLPLTTESQVSPCEESKVYDGTCQAFEL
jgi:hypothetical protein